MMNATLTAIIKHNGVTIQTLTKNGLYAYIGFKGSYISSMGSGPYSAPNPIFTAPNTYVHITYASLIGATISYNGDATPTYWLTNYDTIDVGMPSTGNSIVIHVICDNGQAYNIPIIKTTNPHYISFSQNGELMIITLDESTTKNQTWMLDIFNVTTDEKIVSKRMFGHSVTLNTTGWKRGIYVAHLTIGKEVLTEKFYVK